MKQLLNSELIVNNDGSIYHLGLKPEHLCDTILTVGDPDRVSLITRHFDNIDYEIRNREFVSIGGQLKGERFVVLSTGIGTDNIDIVLNELAFLANYNLRTRTLKTGLRKLRIIRLGTSGSVSQKNRLGDIVYSENAISFDDLFHFYHNDFDTVTFDNRNFPAIPCSKDLESQFSRFKSSLTLTAKGFYGPQFRQSQLAPKYVLSQLADIQYKGQRIGNIEMETAGIYGLSSLLGFEAISINAILANRSTGDFHENPQAVIDQMITETLDILCS